MDFFKNGTSLRPVAELGTDKEKLSNQQTTSRNQQPLTTPPNDLQSAL
jgi:hypothetical protein